VFPGDSFSRSRLLYLHYARDNCCTWNHVCCEQAMYWHAAEVTIYWAPLALSNAMRWWWMGVQGSALARSFADELNHILCCCWTFDCSMLLQWQLQQTLLGGSTCGPTFPLIWCIQAALFKCQSVAVEAVFSSLCFAGTQRVFLHQEHTGRHCL